MSTCNMFLWTNKKDILWLPLLPGALQQQQQRYTLSTDQNPSIRNTISISTTPREDFRNISKVSGQADFSPVQSVLQSFICISNHWPLSS